MVIKLFFSALCATVMFQHTDLYAADTTQTIPSVIWGDLTTSFSTLGYAGNRIISFADYDFVTLGISTAVIVGSTFADEPVRSSVQQASNRSSTMDKITDIVNLYGDLTAPALVTAGIYGTGLLFKDEYIRTTGRMLGEALIIGGTLTTLGKYTFGRARPYLNEGSNSLQPFSWGDDRWSFPSGHATVAFTVSGVLSARIKRWWATAGLYGLASTTAFARMYKDKHWFSDILMGALIGGFTTLTVVDAENERQSTKTLNTQSGVWRVMPIQRGIAITYIF